MKKIGIIGVIGWDVTASWLQEELRKANGEDVTITFQTPGGLVGEGLAMYNMIKNYPGNTYGVLSGYSMSMGSYIPLACKQVMAEENAVYMIHNARGGVWGDHNDIQKYGTYLKGLSGIAAREYVKQIAKRGKEKSLDDINEMMDKETYFFGDEIVEAGFADSLIKLEGGTDKETSLSTAQASFTEAQARMASDQAKVRADLQLAMQVADISTMMNMHAASTLPASAGNKTEEGKQMKLSELLAANPQAKAEYEAALAAARDEGMKAGKEEARAVGKAVSVYIGNSKYPKQVQEVALKVLSGESDKSGLDSVVAMADMILEMQAGSAAAAGTVKTGETPGQQQAVAANAVDVSSPADLDAAVQLARGGA